MKRDFDIYLRCSEQEVDDGLRKYLKMVSQNLEDKKADASKRYLYLLSRQDFDSKNKIPVKYHDIVSA